MSTLIEDLDASSLGLADGAAVSTFTASTGTNLTSSGSARPTFLTASYLSPSGLPIVRFDGVANYLQGSFTQANPCSYVIVFKYRSLPTGSGIAEAFDGSDSTHRLVLEVNNALAANKWSFYAGGAVVSSGTADTNWHVWIIEWNGASTRYQIDGGTWITLSSSPGTNGLTGLTIGAPYSHGSNFAAIDFGQLRIFNGVLTSGEETSEYAAANTKWLTHTPETLAAASASLTDIQAQLTNAQDGDTVVVPPGIASWTSPLSVSKGITLQGATTTYGDHSTVTTIASGSNGAVLPQSTINVGDASSLAPSGQLTIRLSSNTSTKVNYTGKTPTTVTGATGGTGTLATGNKVIGMFATDGTIIQDNLTTDSSVISMGVAAGKNVRVTGFTFQRGTSTTPFNNSGVTISGAQAQNARVDHCHFTAMRRNDCLGVYNNIGVADHNIFTYDNTSIFTQTMTVRHPAWNGDTNGAGDKSWADYPYFGSASFFFFEDNFVDNESTNDIMGCVDGYFGCRYVLRNNISINGQVQTHGTEGRYRGARAEEVYGNSFFFDRVNSHLGGIRTGGYLFHDNTFNGATGPVGPDFNDLRVIYSFTFATPPRLGGNGFYGVTGDNPWDYNATESDGTHVDGHAPYLFYSGTVSSSTAGSVTDTITVSPDPGWTTNQWVGYSVKNSSNAIEMISANTSNTLTMLHDAPSVRPPPVWTNGTAFQIHKALITLDQPGRGKSDLIFPGYNSGVSINSATTTTVTFTNGSAVIGWASNNLYPGLPVVFSNTGGALPTNFVAGTIYYVSATGLSSSQFEVASTIGGTPIVAGSAGTGTQKASAQGLVTQALEPCYSWNNVYAPTGSAINFQPAGNTFPSGTLLTNGVDYFTNSSSGAVVSKYVSALNGVDYTGPYTYPHPLVSTLSVPVFTSADNVAFNIGTVVSFIGGATGNPGGSGIAFTKTGSLPTNTTLIDNGDGTFILATSSPGIPNTSGSPFTFTIHATNSTGTTDQSFTLTVNSPSSIISHFEGTPLDFDPVILGKSSFAYIVVRNDPTSNSNLNVTAVSHSVPSVFKTTVFTTAIGLTPGQGVFIGITAQPTSATTFNNTITITTNATSGENTATSSVTGLPRPRNRGAVRRGILAST